MSAITRPLTQALQDQDSVQQTVFTLEKEVALAAPAPVGMYNAVVTDLSWLPK
jgi:hypothetical protein